MHMTRDTADVAQTPPGGDAAAVTARIMQRMGEGGGFPALDQSVATIMDALERSVDDTTPLVDAVLADVSLTQKVLRLANSAMYAPIGQGVATVSHAVQVLGYEAVGHLALGVKLIGAMGQVASESRSAERELAHSLLAGSVAGSVVAMAGIRNGEMGIVCALLHRMGRLLASFYMPDEWQRIRQAVASGEDEDAAAARILGMTLQDVGVNVARQWRLPARIVNTMATEDVTAAAQGEEWLLAVTLFSDRSADLVVSSQQEISEERLTVLAAEFGPALGLETDEMVKAARAATDEATSEPMLAAILVEPRHPPGAAQAAKTDPLARLKAGVQDLRQALAEGESSLEAQRIALEVALTALDLGRAAVFVLDAGKQIYRVTATRSSRKPNRLEDFTLAAKAGTDLAHIALARKLDIYIDNPRDPKIAPHFPDWILAYGLHPFFLLPMTGTEGNPLGLFYGQQQNDSKLSKEELGQLAALRDLVQQRLRSG